MSYEYEYEQSDEIQNNLFCKGLCFVWLFCAKWTPYLEGITQGKKKETSAIARTGIQNRLAVFFVVVPAHHQGNQCGKRYTESGKHDEVVHFVQNRALIRRPDS